MSHDVCFTAEADRCVYKIVEWLAQQSPEGAGRWLDALELACRRIGDQPDSCGLAPEADSFEEPLRQIVFRTKRGNAYRALFLIRTGSVHVVSVRGAGQPPLTPGEIVIPP
jgi:plasmid stabilization system protein ParE